MRERSLPIEWLLSSLPKYGSLEGVSLNRLRTRLAIEPSRRVAGKASENL